VSTQKLKVTVQYEDIFRDRLTALINQGDSPQSSFSSSRPEGLGHPLNSKRVSPASSTYERPRRFQSAAIYFLWLTSNPHWNWITERVVVPARPTPASIVINVTRDGLALQTGRG